MNEKKLISRCSYYYANKPAVIFDDRVYTFQEVNERANRLANGLMSNGIKKGDTIACLANNCPEHVEVMFALLKCGAVRVAINTRLSPEEILWQLNFCNARALIVGEEFISTIVSIAPKLETVKKLVAVSHEPDGMTSYEELIAKSSPDEPAVPVGKEDLARITFTGGTTGRPKGIMHSVGGNWAVTKNLLLDMLSHLNQNDKFLALQPLYHGAGCYIIPAWIRGVTQVIVPDFDPGKSLEVIEKEKITVLKTIPTILIRLITHPEIKKYDLSSLHTIVYGASPMPTDKLKEAIKIFGPIFIQTYGQSEVPVTITLLRKEDHKIIGPPEELARLSSVGRLYTDMEAKIIDEKGDDLPSGEEGEVIVRGDNIMKGYLSDPVRTGETLRNGWIYTGDIGRRDEAGYLFLVDRKGETIISGGLNIYPSEVEQALYGHPAVMEAAVFGVPDEAWGEAVKAVIALKKGASATEEELIDFCKDRLASYKKPKSIEFRDSLPKSGAGKILRRTLRDEYWRGHDRRIH